MLELEESPIPLLDVHIQSDAIEDQVDNSTEGSVELEDIIQTYDVISRTSETNSFRSCLTSGITQSYFTAPEGSKDEATSFYSALDDEYFGSTSNSNSETTKTARKTNFKVYWHDLAYRIQPSVTLQNIWSGVDDKVKNKIHNVHRLINSGANISRIYQHEGYPQAIQILQHICGSFESGQLTAVIGPSGAGKTSLLNFLSRRREEGYSGSLVVDNSYRKVKISAIPQNDHLPEYLTVRESLMFASKLNNPERDYEHAKNVMRVTVLLGLNDCLDTRAKKISGGQQKRLAIAQELLSKPDILILDEPTSGLDSLTCHKTLSVLKNLVKSSRHDLMEPIAILLTIHQPQHDAFDIFDKVYVLANGGRVIYDGPPTNCIQFIESNSGIHLPNLDYNPASFVIEIASGEYGSEPIRLMEDKVKMNFARSWNILPKRNAIKNLEAKKSTNNFRNKYSSMSKNDDEITSDDIMNSVPNLQPMRSYLYIDERISRGSSLIKGGFYRKTCILSKRYWKSITRDPKQLIARVAFHILLPLVLALMMGTEPGKAKACPNYRSHYNLSEFTTDSSLTSNNVQEELLLTLENLSLLFVLVYAMTSANTASMTLSFTLDMQSSLKEHYNGWYSISSYLIARILTDLPISLILPIICLALGYPLTGQSTEYGLPNEYRILITAVAVILGSIAAQTLGMIIGALCIGHISTVLFASQGAMLPLVFLSGFIVRTKNMSKLVYALSNLSFYRHILDVTVLAKYGFNLCNCNPSDITGLNPELEGVPDGLRSFTRNWFNTLSVQDEVNTQDINKTTDVVDIFQVFAQQVSLYNTYGLEIKSCSNVIPYQLYDVSLQESDLVPALLALVYCLLVMKLFLFITVKLVVRFKTSL